MAFGLRLTNAVAVAVAVLILPCSHGIVARTEPNRSLPRPVPVLEHIAGTTTIISLSRYLPGLDLSGSKLESEIGISADLKGSTLTLTGDFVGFSPLRLVTGSGETNVLLVRGVRRPIVDFVFKPAGTVQSVSLVGGFNGWAAGRNNLDRQPDGSFATKLALDAGTYEYKFVVDGSWIPDPENPNQRPDGFSGFNSVLTVEGSAPAAGRLVQQLEKDGTIYLAVDSLTTGPAPILDPKSVIVLLGNNLYDTFEAGENYVALDLPKDGLHAVRVFARDTEGREVLPAEFVHGLDRTWRDEIMYFVFTDRFRDGNPSNNDPVNHPDLAKQANFQGGDWDGIRLAIEEGYFTNLGVTTIWISPPQRQPDGAWRDAIPPNRMFTGYHGYWPTAPREVNQRFGTTESLHKMISAAHANGIKVVMDCVANHVHVDHPYYKQHPEWFGVYELPDGRKNLRLFDEFPLTTWFDTFLPKFDYARNPAAVQAVVDDIAWWVETFGFDGLRHDATKHIPHEFWLALTERIRGIERARNGASIYQVGESISSRDVIMEYVNAAEMDGQFDFPLYWPLRGVFASQNDAFGSLVSAIRDNRRVYGAFSIHSAFVGNHDFSRFMAFATGDVPPSGENEQAIGWTKPPNQPTDKQYYDRLKMAHTFVMSQPDQIPLIYYGDEFGLTGAGDPDNRRMMKFGKDVPPNGRAVMDHVAKLTKLRKQHRALRTGDTTVLHEAGDLLVLLRSTAQERLVVAFNRKPTRETLSVRLPAWAVDGAVSLPKMLLGDKGTSVKAEGKKDSFGLTMPPRSSAIFIFEP